MYTSTKVASLIVLVSFCLVMVGATAMWDGEVVPLWGYTLSVIVGGIDG